MSAWGKSWGAAWGNAWGAVGAVVSAVKTVGGGIGHHKKKKRVYIERDGSILVFANASRAAEWIAAEKAQETKTQQTRIRPPKPPETVIDVDYLAHLLERFHLQNSINKLLELQQYAALVDLYERAMERLEEDDVELLLLAA